MPQRERPSPALLLRGERPAPSDRARRRRRSTLIALRFDLRGQFRRRVREPGPPPDASRESAYPRAPSRPRSSLARSRKRTLRGPNAPTPITTRQARRDRGPGTDVPAPRAGAADGSRALGTRRARRVRDRALAALRERRRAARAPSSRSSEPRHRADRLDLARASGFVASRPRPRRLRRPRARRGRRRSGGRRRSRASWLHLRARRAAS